MNIFKKRSTIVLATFGAIGAIAALATAASFALFYDPVPVSQTFQAGTVTLSTSPTVTCNARSGDQVGGAGASQVSGSNVTTPVLPGYSTQGYPGGLGDHSGQVCTFTIDYSGSADAFLATDVSVMAPPGTNYAACTGLATAKSGCSGLYSPQGQMGANAATDLQIWPTYTVNGTTYALGIGNNQTISQPGTGKVDTGYQYPSGASLSCGSNGDFCPVRNGFSVTYQVYVYWPMGTSAEQNQYQGSSATITMSLHAVQAYDNPLQACTALSNEGDPSGWAYQAPDQPSVGWGSGLSTGQLYGTVSPCPTIDNSPNDWSSSTTTLYPFSHVSSETETWNLATNSLS